MDDVTLLPATTLDAAALAALFVRAFAGYVVAVEVDAAGLARLLRIDGVDLGESLVALVGGAPAGLALVALRGSRSRIASMGVVAEARRLGVGRRLLDAAIAGVTRAGQRQLILEVIASNHPARALYAARGFSVRRRLVGYERDADPGRPARGDASALVDVDAGEVAAAVLRHGAPELPWQLAPASLFGHTPPTRGVRLGDAWALLSPGPATLVLHSLVVTAERRRRGAATALLDALDAAYPARAWRIPARSPEGLGAELLAARGFRLGALSQLELSLELGPR